VSAPGRAQIKLPAGDTVLVDAEDLEMLSRWRWSLAGLGYARAYNGGGRLARRFVYMHRLLMLPDPSQEVDHVNGDKLDNRRANLRLCTRAENQHNRIAQANNTSGFKGVHWCSGKSKWRAVIKKDGQSYYLGRFANVYEAALVYGEAAKELHGEYARTNAQGPM